MINIAPAQCADVNAAKPRQVADVLLSEAFTVDDVGQVRVRCYHCALDAGLTHERALMFAFSINEAMLNAIQHGGGRGVVLVLHDGVGRLIAEVVDGGPGVTSPLPEQLPLAEANGGRGLWLARRLVDQLTMEASEEGTTLRLEVACGREAYPWSGSPHDVRMATLLAAILLPG